MKREIWKPVIGFPRYAVSNLGRVRGPHGLLKPIRNNMGRLCFTAFTKKGRRKQFRIHREVLRSHKGPRPGYFALHSDGNCLNNELSNLRWGTHTDNMRDKFRHGTAAIGEQNPFARLTEVAVRRIRSSGESSAYLAREFGVDKSTVQLVRRGKTWRHVV